MIIFWNNCYCTRNHMHRWIGGYDTGSPTFMVAFDNYEVLDFLEASGLYWEL